MLLILATRNWVASDVGRSDAGAGLPLRVLAYADETAHVHVSYHDPSHAGGRHGCAADAE